MRGMVRTLQLAAREIEPFKAIVEPNIGSRTVLTDEPWGFVLLWLRRTKRDEALFYWEQAREFHRAAIDMPLQSSPLLHYYSFMNAAKALLSAKGLTFDAYHGVKGFRDAGKRISLANEKVRIENAGVLPSLSTYLGETETAKTHSLKEIFFNLPYIHRTYCLTYAKQSDMFFPLRRCRYVVNDSTKEAYFSAMLSTHFTGLKYVRHLPGSLVADQSAGDGSIRSQQTVTLKGLHLKSPDDKESIRKLNQSLRHDVMYIRGAQTLWYAKGEVNGAKRLKRFPLTLTQAAMHRLSSLSRYHPFELRKLLTGPENWLVGEFVSQAPVQFIDEMACEITGYSFMAPNVRPAT